MSIHENHWCESHQRECADCIEALEAELVIERKFEVEILTERDHLKIQLKQALGERDSWNRISNQEAASARKAEARIRALETELAKTTEMLEAINGQYEGQRTRAEKAEAELDQMKRDWCGRWSSQECRMNPPCTVHSAIRQLKARAERAEARVRELEGHLGRAPPDVSPSPRVPPFPGYSHCKTCTCFEARETERVR